MENKTRSRVMLAITLFSAIVLSGTVFVCARRAGEEVTQRSFDELTTATKQLAKDINNATRTDQIILSAMAELIAGLTKPTAAIVLGGSHSIGVPLAVAAQRSFAVPSAAMTIHPVRISGTVIAAPQTFSYFQRLQERIVAFVAGHSHISAERFQALMLAKDDMAADVGSVVYGEEAVELGIIDQLGGLPEGLAWLYRKMDEKRG